MIRVAGVLLIQGTDYILQHRDATPTIAEPDTYSLWGGTLEGDEEPIAGARRELEEETGVHVALTDLLYLHDYQTVGKGPASFGKPVRAYLYVCVVPLQAIVECREGQGLVRIPRWSGLHPKLNEFAAEAIEIYEATT
jgi:8-oxo-dGTP pyrophosphatase MutT (NUDIX family)